MMQLKKAHVSWLPGLLLGALLFCAQPSVATAQSIVVMVNGDPVTSYELAQRQRFLAMHGVNERLQQKLKSSSIQDDFRSFAMKQPSRPTSQAEMQELQKKFVQQLQQNVLSELSGSVRKQALEELIDEKLMLQAASQLKVLVTDQEVDQFLLERAQAGDKKMTLDEFLGQFTRQGINPKTLKSKIKASRSWSNVIRQVYGSRVQASVSTVTSTVEGDAGSTVDVQVVRLAVPAGGDQKNVAKRLVDAERIRKQFKGCATINDALKGVEGASVKAMNKAKLTDFRGDVRSAIQKAQVGQMTPPAIDNGAVELHAICTKAVAVATGQTTKNNNPQEKLQEAFQLYSRRHLKDLRDHARLDYVKGNG